MSLLVDLLRRGFSLRASCAVLRIVLVALLGSLIPAAPDVVAAETYPSRPITLIVPYPAGGGVDAMARIVAERLSTALGKQVLVDNRGGGGGLIGTRAVARAAPDGYTLLLGHTGTIAINPTLYANPGYDPRKDFAPIGLIATIPLVLLAHPSLPAKTVAEVIAYARREPGKLNIGSAPIGTGSYMCAELFKAAADIHATVVPYKGTAPLTNDLVGGHVPVGFGVIPPALGNVQSGTLRAVAVTSRARTKLLPDVPTFDESGLPGFYAVLNYGLLAPAGMPAEIIARLSQELGAALHGEEVRQRIAADGGDVLTSTAEEYAADIDRDEKQWSALVRKLGFAGGVKAMHSSYALFDTAFGTCALAWNERGITRLRLPEAKPAVLEARMAARGRERGIPTVAVADAMAEVRRYFGGEQTSFSEIVLDLAGCEPFDRAIYAALRRIRWGTTASYGELAGAAGAPKAARAVGRAMGRNPVPIIIPCHRVITADGRIGGFSAPGGVDTKDRLHRLEGIVLATDAPLLRLMA